MTAQVPQSTRILLVRHGETDWNRQQRIQGHVDIGLNPTGLDQADRLANALVSEPVSAVYCSDLSRAYATAQAVALAKGVPLQVEPALRERNYGAFEGLTFADIEQQWPEQALAWRQRDPQFAPDGGESLLDLWHRVVPTLHALSANHLGQQIMVVTHGGVIDLLYRAASGMDLTSKRTWDLTNTAVNRLLWSPQGLSLVAWGDTQHLDAVTPH